MLKHWRILDSSSGSMRVGKIDGIKHNIVLKENPNLSYQKPRPLNPIIRQKVEKQLEKWEKQNVIEKSDGFPRHTSPLVPVLKKDGENIRCTVDFRKLNAESIQQVYPIANIQEALASLAGNSLFSVIDCQNAYHSIELEESCKNLTGISTTIGCFIFNRLPFGLHGATQTYSQAIALTLGTLPTGTALAYLDDAICPASNFDDMIRKLDSVFNAFGKAGIIINASKTKLCQGEVDYLGFEVSKQGIGTVKAYTKAITAIPLPTTITETKSILGKFSYYRRFIECFSKIARPLVEAYTAAERRNEKHIKITEDVIESVQTLKNKITKAPILAHPDWQSPEPFKVKTDFSCKALGAKITQMQRDQNGELQERVILYDSKKTTKIEERYQSNKGELLAFIWAAQKHRFLLYPRKFIFVTDHIALRAIKTMNFPRSLSLRWLDIVSNFNFEVEYRKAKLHEDVDFLSRHAIAKTADKGNDSNTDKVNEEEEKSENNALIIHEMTETTSAMPSDAAHTNVVTAEEFKQAQDSDEIIQVTKEWLESGTLPDRTELLEMPLELRQYMGILPALQVLEDGLLVRKRLPGEHLEMRETRPCIPTELQQK